MAAEGLAVQLACRVLAVSESGYYARRTRGRAVDSGLLPSMGSVGDCFDNAVMESFWSRMQVELLDRKRWRTRLELANAIFEYLEVFHNRQRRQTSLSMLTPVEFEARHQPITAA